MGGFTFLILHNLIKVATEHLIYGIDFLLIILYYLSGNFKN